MANSESFSLDRFELTPPLIETEIDSLLAESPFPVIPEVRQLYSICNGGHSKQLHLQILPLAEALKLTEVYTDCYPSMSYWPFSIQDATSDPCCVVCNGPAVHYVVHLFHDNDDRFKARSLQSFFTEIANVQANDWWLEDDLLEFRDSTRTAADIEMAHQLLAVAEECMDDFDEALHLFDLVFNFLPDERVDDIAEYLGYPYFEIRDAAKHRLKNVPAAAPALERAEQELATYTEQAVKILQDAGLDARATDKTSIRVYPGGVLLSVKVFFDKRNDPDGWDFLVERTKEMLARHER